MQNDNGLVISRKVHGPKTRVSGFPAMEPLCNAFATICATACRKTFRAGIEVGVFGYESVRHGDYLRQLRTPSAIYLLTFPRVHGAGLVRAHPRLLAKVLDLSLGGDGTVEATGPERPLTTIDLAIYGRFVDLVNKAFNEAVEELCGQSSIGLANRGRFEEQPGMIRIAPDRAEVFSIKLAFFVGGDEKGAGLDFVVPVSTLEPLKQDLAAQGPANEEILAAWEKAMREHVMDLPLNAEGVIELGMFSVGELSRLEQGDLIDLPPDAINSVELRVQTVDGDTILAHGRLGAKGRHKAVRLIDDPNPGFLAPMRLVEGEPPEV